MNHLLTEKLLRRSRLFKGRAELSEEVDESKSGPGFCSMSPHLRRNIDKIIPSSKVVR